MADKRERHIKTQEQLQAVERLSEALLGDAWKEALWDCICCYQGYPFETAGRGRARTGAVSFSYQLKTSARTGETTDELLISRKERSKTLTRSSVELAMENARKELAAAGCVRGPKRLQVFGSSYLYAIFLEWGVIWKEKREAL